MWSNEYWDGWYYKFGGYGPAADYKTNMFDNLRTSGKLMTFGFRSVEQDRPKPKRKVKRKRGKK